jgi:poly(A) polymerase
MKLPAAEWQRRPGMRPLLKALGAAEGETRYVGGCVRDALLGEHAHDIDLATRLAPEEVIRRLEEAGIKAVPTGIAHGTVTAVSKGVPVEVTTLRRDVSTDGRRATIAYTAEWQEDAARRDFTINAISANPATGELFDYFDGLADLQAGRVRFIGEALTRIAEDHLRILRFFRFHARFGRGEPDGPAIEACTTRANDLMALSRERIADELLKLLTLPHPEAAARLMVERGILKPVLPEIGTEGVGRLETLVARETAAGVAAEPVRRLAALLPAEEGAAAAVAARLRLSKKISRRLTCAAARGGETERPEALAYRIGRDEAVDRLLLGDGDAAAAVAALAQWERPRLHVGGGDLIAMGLKPGPAVAATLQATERDWADAGFPPDTEEQRRIARRRVDQALRERQ